MPDKFSHILNDRTSGSVALLNRLIGALEEELRRPDPGAAEFGKLLTTIREKLKHFAAIENFLASLIGKVRPEDAFPGTALRFIEDYRFYWQDSSGKIADHFLQLCEPLGKTILTHSHSHTVISLLDQLHLRQIPFRVLQTRSSPGGEGRESLERLAQLEIRTELIEDADVKEVLRECSLVLMGCDALLDTEFLNKTGTRAILEQANQFNIRSFLVTESRKEITHADWKQGLTVLPLFEWVPLDLAERVVTERGI